MTLAEACALVDRWGPACNWGLHDIARTLRAVVPPHLLPGEPAPAADWPPPMSEASRTYERSRELASPVREWSAYCSYEAAWDRALCDPEPVPVDVKALTSRLSSIEFALLCIGNTLRDQEAQK